MTTDEPRESRLTLVFRGVSDLTSPLANAVYEAADGECEIGMRDRLLYIEVPVEGGWEQTPNLLAAVRAAAPRAELVRVEAADMVTAAERANGPLKASA